MVDPCWQHDQVILFAFKSDPKFFWVQAVSNVKISASFQEEPNFFVVMNVSIESNEKEGIERKKKKKVVTLRKK